jgi:hypothetical protein
MGAFEFDAEPTFVLSLVPEDTVSVAQADSANVLAIVTSFLGFDQPVDLSFSGLPSGVTGMMDPPQVIPTDTSILRIQTDPDATPGLYPVTVTATSDDITRQKNFTLYVLPPSYDGPVWYVSTEGDDLGGNGSGELPFRTIQHGINSADNGDTVLVERGVYVENISYLGKSVLVSSHFILDSLESTIDSTVIDGNHQGSVVTFDSGEDSNAVITGFTITKGYASYGSGIHCSGSSPTITYNFVIRDSSHWGYSGGVGIYCAGSSHVMAYRNLIADCYGPAAVLCLGNSSIELVNNTIANNAAGGVSVQSGSFLYAKNNISYNNAAYGIHVSESDWDITYNDSYGHDQDWEGIPDQEGVNGNISDDPLFLDPSAGDYHLTAGSPCIDAGDPPDTDMGAFDFGEGEPDFRLALVPNDTALVYLTYSTDVLAIVTSVAGFDQPVDLSYSGLPTGVSGMMDPPQVIPTDTAVFTIEAAAHATPGFYLVTVTATGDDITREKQIILDVRLSGRVWHVSTDGDDETGDGSADFPFRTIQKGIDSAEDEDTVMRRTYTSSEARFW